MKHIKEKLAEREAHNALRSLKQRHFAIDFYSNDYIGFSTNSEITKRISQLLPQQTAPHGLQDRDCFRVTCLSFPKPKAI